jgi:hypothetical protein
MLPTVTHAGGCSFQQQQHGSGGDGGVDRRAYTSVRGCAPSAAAAACAGSKRARGGSGMLVQNSTEEWGVGVQGCSGFGLQDVPLMPSWGERGRSDGMVCPVGGSVPWWMMQ